MIDHHLNKKSHNRKSLRLKYFDYSLPGAYFITIVSWQRECIFGELGDGKMLFSPIGTIIQSEWQKLSQHFQNVRPAPYTIMPNYIHSIIIIEKPLITTPDLSVGNLVRNEDVESDITKDGVGGSHPQKSQKTGPASNSLGMFIGQFKSRSTKRIWKLMGMNRRPVWQRGYYESIVRDEKSLENIYRYIEGNPSNWYKDEYFTHR